MPQIYDKHLFKLMTPEDQGHILFVRKKFVKMLFGVEIFVLDRMGICPFCHVHYVQIQTQMQSSGFGLRIALYCLIFPKLFLKCRYAVGLVL